MMKSTQRKTILKTLLVFTSFLVGFSSSFSSSLFAEPLPLSKEGPAVFQPGGGTNSGPPGGPVKPATGDSEKPFVNFKTSEQRKLVFPAPAVGKGEAGKLAALDKETKKKWLKTLKEFNQNLPQEVEEERALGKKEYDLVYNDSITDAKNPIFNPLLSSPHIDGPIFVEDSSVDTFNANKRTPTLNLNLEGIASFQGKNRDAEGLGFTEKLVEVTRDPELALAVGIDVIAGSVIRPFFNSAMKVGEELTRQIECASSGLSVSTGCGTPSEWQDYWAGLMTGEAKPYMLTDAILDSVFAIPGIAAAGAAADASVEALKKVPAALKEAAVVVEQSADALKAATPALSFSIDAQSVLAKEADNAVVVVKASVGTSEELANVAQLMPDLHPRAAKHVVRGDFNSAGKLTGGLHTPAATDSFIAKLSPDIQSQISREILPNGVERVVFPEGVMSDPAYEATRFMARSGRGVVGGKSLFPKEWSPDKINAAVKEVRANGVIISSEGERQSLKGVFEGISIEVNIGPAKGGGVQVNSAFPSWIQ